MTEKEIRIHNLALLYEIISAIHPNEPLDIGEMAANYDATVKELKTYFR